jgi:AcrR family transcriptional regulator
VTRRLSEKKKARTSRRLSQQTRRRMIIEEAIKLFAENGFRASTRELAERIGVTQPLLFQHFPTKDALIQAIFDTWFERMSARDWIGLLRDKNRDLRSRLIEFFFSYATTIYDYSWIRIYMFAGLEGGEFNRFYISELTDPLLREIATQIRADFGIAHHTPADVTSAEIELLWILHGGLYYSAIRKQIYGLETGSPDLRELIAHSVDAVLAGMRRLLANRTSRISNHAESNVDSQAY